MEQMNTRVWIILVMSINWYKQYWAFKDTWAIVVQYCWPGLQYKKPAVNYFSSCNGNCRRAILLLVESRHHRLCCHCHMVPSIFIRHLFFHCHIIASIQLVKRWILIALPVQVHYVHHREGHVSAIEARPPCSFIDRCIPFIKVLL
jgi:hypothetical protein